MPGIARRAQRAVGALLIGRADQETDPLARIHPRDEARNRRLDLVGHVGIGAFGLDVARPRLEVERLRSEEHTSELQSLMRISYAVFCLKKKKNKTKYSEQ